MSLSRFLKSAGILEDDKPAADVPASTKAVPPARNPTPSVVHAFEGDGTPVDDISAGGPMLMDCARVEALIEDHVKGTPEFELFLTFQKQADAMKGVIGDERTRFMAAQATTNISCADLCKSVESYVAVVAFEADQFTADFVAKEQAHIDQCTGLVTSLQQEIDELTAKLGDLSKRKADASAEIIALTAGLDKASIDFRSVVSTVTGRYEETLKKLHQHLGL